MLDNVVYCKIETRESKIAKELPDFFKGKETTIGIKIANVAKNDTCENNWREMVFVFYCAKNGDIDNREIVKWVKNALCECHDVE